MRIPYTVGWIKFAMEAVCCTPSYAHWAMVHCWGVHRIRPHQPCAMRPLRPCAVMACRRRPDPKIVSSNRRRHPNRRRVRRSDADAGHARSRWPMNPMQDVYLYVFEGYVQQKYTFCGWWPFFRSIQNLATLMSKLMSATMKNLICKCVPTIFNKNSSLALRIVPMTSNFIRAFLNFFLCFLPRVTKWIGKIKWRQGGIRKQINKQAKHTNSQITKWKSNC